MRLVTVVLIALLVLIQFPLWWGHGGWLRVHELQQQLAVQQKKNADLKLRNDRLLGEVQDLQNGTAAIEERARYELGMVKDSELFVQLVGPNAVPSPSKVAGVTTLTSTRGNVSVPVSVVPDPVSRERAKKHAKVARDARQKSAKPHAPPGR